MNKLKIISITICCAVIALCSEIQGTEEALNIMMGNIRNTSRIDFEMEIVTLRSGLDEVKRENFDLMEQERQTFNRVLDQVKQESADLRQLNANLTDKLENFSQQLINFQLIANQQLEQERIVIANLNEQLRQKVNGLESSQKRCAKAWVVFNGYDANILDSYGVLSVIKKAPARYTVNFSEPFSSENYCATWGSVEEPPKVFVLS